LSRLLGFAQRIDALTTGVGRAASWLYPLLVVVLLVNVVARYGFGVGSIELEEFQWHLYAAAFLLGLAYTYAADEHVRVDVLAVRLGPRARLWIELLGCLLLLGPFAAIATFHAFDFFWESLQLGERSPMPSGLPARWIIKGVLFAALLLLTLQALAVAARAGAALAGTLPGGRHGR
jgi:TRAP-type mannitol/chloroaromatic compound transport system permease small subunit